MFTKKLRFGSYRTIVLSPKQPSFEKIVALVFHSTNWTTDGSTMFFWLLAAKRFPGQNFSVAIEQESPTTFV